jgi:hypothetical protein
VLQRMVKAFDDVSRHRGGRLSRLGEALRTALLPPAPPTAPCGTVDPTVVTHEDVSSVEDPAAVPSDVVPVGVGAQPDVDAAASAAASVAEAAAQATRGGSARALLSDLNPQASEFVPTSVLLGGSVSDDEWDAEVGKAHAVLLQEARSRAAAPVFPSACASPAAEEVVYGRLGKVAEQVAGEVVPMHGGALAASVFSTASSSSAVAPLAPVVDSTGAPLYAPTSANFEQFIQDYYAKAKVAHAKQVSMVKKKG